MLKSSLLNKNCLLTGILFLIVSTSSNLPASEEEVALWRSMDVDYGQIGQAKTVRLLMHGDGSAVSSMKIHAFDREINISASALKELGGLPYLGFRLTHEMGYQALGGYTVYFNFGIHSPDSTRGRLAVKAAGEPELKIEAKEKI